MKDILPLILEEIAKASPKMEKYLKSHPYMEPNGLQGESIEEEWSASERKKRKSKCDNPKGFTMKQFCKNQRTRSKKGEKRNEAIRRRSDRYDPRNYVGRDAGRGFSAGSGGEIPPTGQYRQEAKDPKVGTGKKPKGSGRRLYTDENPKDTVSVEFSSVAAIKRTLAKASFKAKSHKRQSQIINLIHQRVRAAYRNAKDSKVKARLKKAYKYAEQRKEASKKKTQRLRKAKK